MISSVKSSTPSSRVKRTKKPHTDGFPGGLRGGFGGMMRMKAYLGEIQERNRGTLS